MAPTRECEPRLGKKKAACGLPTGQSVCPLYPPAKRREKINRKLKIKVWHHFVGEWVMLFDYESRGRLDKKFAPLWKGPYIILKQVSKTRFLLGGEKRSDPRGRKPYLIVHANQIKHWFA